MNFMKVGTYYYKWKIESNIPTAVLSIDVLRTCSKSENDSLIGSNLSPKPLIKC